jgi:uncharacterized protein HemX
MLCNNQIHHNDHVNDELHDSDHESESSSTSDQGSNYRDGAAAATTEPESDIAKQETQDVFRLKLVVGCVLIVAALGVAAVVFFYLRHSEEHHFLEQFAALGVAAVVFFYLRHSEEHQFLEQFKEDATKILDALEGTVDQTMAALSGVAVNMVSTAKMTHQTWPFVTIDDFAVCMSKVVPLARALCISYYQVIHPKHATSGKSMHWTTTIGSMKP